MDNINQELWLDNRGDESVDDRRAAAAADDDDDVGYVPEKSFKFN